MGIQVHEPFQIRHISRKGRAPIGYCPIVAYNSLCLGCARLSRPTFCSAIGSAFWEVIPLPANAPPLSAV